MIPTENDFVNSNDNAYHFKPKEMQTYTAKLNEFDCYLYLYV